RDDAEQYLSDRQQRGFNPILVSLIEHRFSTNPPANAYGRQPFSESGNFATPNDAYFVDAKWVLETAASKGILVLLVPAYLGAGGGGEGWYAEMARSGAQSLKSYGAYLGNRYKDLSNIVWVLGGDYDAPDKTLIRAMVEGLTAANPLALKTVHSSRDTVTSDYWAGDRWLDLDTAYTYDDVYAAVAAETGHTDPRPVLLIESLYEGEHGTGEQLTRKSAYSAILAGAAGQVFGNSPIWHFDAPGIQRSWISWQAALASGGSRSMQYVPRLFESLDWWRLRADSGEILDRRVDGNRTAVAGRAVDGSFAVVYLSTANRVTLELSKLNGARVSARWFDPTSGEFSDPEDFPTTGPQRFAPPGPLNRNGFTDWLLVLSARG
ncbi:MAG: hypothetical protein JWN11_1040, partial [Hyphomicrobiales bacterium]|nr:hypothetical protein [Hyphomicrobiales bacterium]